MRGTGGWLPGWHGRLAWDEFSFAQVSFSGVLLVGLAVQALQQTQTAAFARNVSDGSWIDAPILSSNAQCSASYALSDVFSRGRRQLARLIRPCR
jgi:hypothetical protein